ncbi:hypothetical protein LAV84_30235 [Rhizobium sp. VS19-DR104.2]|uniref:hypothetical protein n=1 Tax=unclassified Rhizobium TaxID=2613769 RepID=UPI001CC6C738|nr:MULTISPECIES: hypothetical protein [unclassified Rhizobium]MBZ5763727.1 hypothetical protein [Rhizobium sp. VS19-DR96]MBZ5769661.1 hypothetical protein [Rhizobium sp. VS19-DR129.2]MBZ5777196.1 hypothetical protein [Rhizobium sp. VS19-DRK62.2]MBZ5788341.1 hypothetical protein [Rhizobium sp. VS19-DR121]MBZ5805752.1 hypothetical protein [Rhizobium sp. VS19-DR181]
MRASRFVSDEEYGVNRRFSALKGAIIHDDFGRNLIDFSNADGAVFIGHNDAELNNALIKHLESGCFTGGYIGEAFDQVTAEISSVFSIGSDETLVNYFASGTAALRSVVSALRSITGNKLILSCGYHGWDEAWSPAEGLLSANAHGVIDFYFEMELFWAALDKFGDAIGSVVFSPDFLYHRQHTFIEIARVASARGMIVVCDDVYWGLRTCYGPSIPPCAGIDAYVVSKCLSNGHRLAALAGRKMLVEATRGDLSTSQCSEMPFVATGVVLNRLKDGLERYKGLAARGDVFVETVGDLLREAGCTVRGNGSAFVFCFGNNVQEKKFYDTSYDRGLLFEVGWVQSTSLAFESSVFDEAENRIAEVSHKLGNGDPPSLRDEFQLAWREIHGLPLIGKFSDRIAYLELLLSG